MDVSGYLALRAEEKYRAFTSSLLPGVRGIVGVRLPALRALAKEIMRGDWRAYLERGAADTFEETMVRAFVIAMAPMDTSERMRRGGDFLGEIDNWSVCDSFCGALKDAKNAPETYLAWIDEALRDERPFARRFALVMLLRYYTDENHIDGTLARVTGADVSEYYVRMAAAWALCTCYFADRQKTAAALDHAVDRALRLETGNKIVQSRLATDADRAYVGRIRTEAAP